MGKDRERGGVRLVMTREVKVPGGRMVIVGREVKHSMDGSCHRMCWSQIWMAA